MFTRNDNHMIYGFSDIECNRQIFFVILGHFLPFYPLTARKIKIKNNPKKLPRDIIILHMCTKNYDQMMYGSWDMVCDGCNYFSFWAIFCPFLALTAQKIKIKENWKNTCRYHHFTYVYQKLWSDDTQFLRYDARQM